MAELYVKPGERGRRAGDTGRPLPRLGRIPRGVQCRPPPASLHTHPRLRRQQGARLERPAAVLLRAPDPGWRTQAHAAHQEGRRAAGWVPPRCVGALCAESGRGWEVLGVSLSRGLRGETGAPERGSARALFRVSSLLPRAINGTLVSEESVCFPTMSSHAALWFIFLILKFYFQPVSLPWTLVCCTSSLDCIVSILDLTCKINHLISITDLLSTSYKPGTAEG